MLVLCCCCIILAFWDVMAHLVIFLTRPVYFISLDGFYLALSRSLPALEVLGEISLMSLLRWNLEINMEKTICSSSNGKIILVWKFLCFSMKLFSYMLLKLTWSIRCLKLVMSFHILEKYLCISWILIKKIRIYCNGHLADSVFLGPISRIWTRFHLYLA